MLKWIEIDKKIIEGNIKSIKSVLKKERLMVVVKSDGYGHNCIKISEIAEDMRADFLGVMNIYEADVLRKNGIKLPVMLLAPSLTEDMDIILKNNVIPTADDINFLKLLNKKSKRIVDVNIDVDMGLKRWGIELKDIEPFVKEVKKLKNINLFSISTHIAYTPYKNMVEAREKLEKFKEETDRIKKIYPSVIVHAANSLVFLDFPQFYFDMVRIGNLIYGIYPSEIYLKRPNNPVKLGIKRPWKFFAKIISIKNVKKGESFGYASEIVATRNMRIATIPVGYSDGLATSPMENVYQITEGQKYWGVINGKIAPFVSKPAISHTLLDITDIQEARLGSTVSLAIRRTAANSDIPRIYI
ncbi:MAG: alanine racemase [Elusimicrobia bacterium]|nr:alanine racemase [Elusimicrobiota bacterium]